MLYTVLRLPETKIYRVKIIIYLDKVLKTQSRNYVSMLLSHNVVKVRFFQRETFWDVKNQNIWDNFRSTRV